MIVNLEDYGLDVRPDGVYADAALEAALSDSASRQIATPLGTFVGGLRIMVNGLYHLEGTHQRTLPVNTYLQGCGRTTGFICHADGLVIADQNATNYDTDSEISDLTLFSLCDDKIGIHSDAGAGCLIKNVYFSGWHIGIDLDNVNSFTVERCLFGGDVSGSVQSTGIRLRNESNVNAVRDCRFNCWRGVDHAGGASNKILSSNFNGPEVGVLVRGATNLYIEGNFESTTSCGVLVDAPAQVAAINLTIAYSFHSTTNGGNQPMLRLTNGTVIYGLNLITCIHHGGTYMVENPSASIAGAFVIGNRHYGSGPIFENDVTTHESTFYASSAYGDSVTRHCTGVGTVKPVRTLEVFDGPVDFRLRDGTGVRLDLP